ncbi:MAG: prolyl aminopeptidase [Candidatus Limnocylindria bacterium]
MTELYAEVEPYRHGTLDVGDGNRVYWETCGNPSGKPAIVFHGGPGSGAATWFRRLFDPNAYRVVLFDQRGCGRSTPHASEPETDLTTNTIQNLIADAELLRGYLGVERWLVLAGSWGSTLALAYAEAHPKSVSEMVLFGVTTGRHAEFDWTFRGGLAAFFPEQWEHLCAGVPSDRRVTDVIEAYHRLLNDRDADVRRRAAEAWCLWESATLDWPPRTGLAERFRDPAYAMAFARLVTHYVRQNGFLEDGALLRDAARLAHIPGVLVNGRFDFQAPIGNAWALRRAWPQAKLVVVDAAGHGGSAEIRRALVQATDGFARSD